MAVPAHAQTPTADDPIDGTTSPIDGSRGAAAADGAPRGANGAATFLGVFSLGLGLAELLAPYAMTRLIGIRRPEPRHRATMQLMGLREIGHGVAILGSGGSAPSVWSRVAGDALDLVLLGRTYAMPDADPARTTFATLNVLSVAAADLVTARKLSDGEAAAR